MTLWLGVRKEWGVGEAVEWLPGREGAEGVAEGRGTIDSLME
jgi:hypothetical protein